MEIWEIHQPHWSLPIAVSKIDRQNYEVTFPAEIPLLKLQKRAITDFILAHGWEVSGRYFIQENVLNQVAFQTKRHDPETIVRWNLGAVSIPERQFHDVEEDAFLAPLVGYGQLFESKSQASFYWRMIVRRIMEWVLFEGKILNLQFCAMAMLPYRVDWKCYVMHRQMDEIESNKKATARDSILLDPQLISANAAREWRARHCLEVIPRYLFWRLSGVFERHRKGDMDMDHYCRDLHNRMAQLIPYAKAAFYAYNRQSLATHPIVSLGDNGSFIYEDGIEWIDQENIRRRQNCFVSVRSVDDAKATGPDSSIEPLAAKTENVSTLPDL